MSPTPAQKRIAILGSRGIPARYGGFETFAEELSVRLVERGHAVTVFCPWRRGPRPAEHRGVRLEYVCHPRLPAVGSLLYDAASLWRARRGYDAVYMLGYGASALCALPRLGGAEVWINMDGLEWERSKWSGPARAWLALSERLALRTATRLVFDNAAVAERVLARHRARVAHEVIEYGASRPAPVADAAERLARHGLRTGDYYLVVARCEPENQVLELARAFRRADPVRPLVLVTNPRAGDAYGDTLRAEHGGPVRVLGPVYDAGELGALRAHAFAYVHGHTVGGTNPSLLEAMACGNLVLADDNPFNREVLGENGLYFAGAGALAACLARAEAVGVEERRAFAAGCLARIDERYDWERIADAYADLLARAGRPAPALPAEAAA